MQELLIARPEALRRDGPGGGLIAQAVHPEGLSSAHLPLEPQEGVAALVVDLGADAVDQILPLTVGIVAAEYPLLRAGTEQELPQQGGGLLEDGRAVQGVGVVQKAAQEAHALDLAPGADHRFDGAAVQLVQRGGQGLHVGVRLGAPAEDRGEQGVAGRRRPVQRNQERRPQNAGLEFFGMDRRQMDAGKQFASCRFGHRPPFLSLGAPERRGWKNPTVLLGSHRGQYFIIPYFSGTDTSIPENLRFVSIPPPGREKIRTGRHKRRRLLIRCSEPDSKARSVNKMAAQHQQGPAGRFAQTAALLPAWLRNPLERLPQRPGPRLEEIRLRAGQPVRQDGLRPRRGAGRTGRGGGGPSRETSP